MKIPSVFVLDASALLKPLLQEIGKEIVEKIFFMKDQFKISLLVPDIFRYEFFNIITREKGQEIAVKGYKALTEKQISILPLETDIMMSAAGLMQKYPRISFYYAVYHALAKAYKVPFVTADEKYYEMVKGEPDVVHLETLEVNV